MIWCRDSRLKLPLALYAMSYVLISHVFAIAIQHNNIFAHKHFPCFRSSSIHITDFKLSHGNFQHTTHNSFTTIIRVNWIFLHAVCPSSHHNSFKFSYGTCMVCSSDEYNAKCDGAWTIKIVLPRLAFRAHINKTHIHSTQYTNQTRCTVLTIKILLKLPKRN